MSFRLLNRCAILFFVFVAVARTEAARIKVAILDGVPSNGRGPRTEAQWVASLRKGARIQFFPTKESAVSNDARLRWGR